MSFDLAAALREAQAGHEAYQRGDFGAAAAAYERALATGADAAHLHYDLGNAHYRAGRLGDAALAWERALRRDPGDDDARHNLRLVRDQSPGGAQLVGEEPFLLRVGGRVAPDLAAGLLVAAWFAACAAAIARLQAGRPVLRGALLGLGLLALLGTAVAGFATFAGWHVRNRGEAVVIEEKVAVLEAPRAGATVAFELSEGFKVRAAERSGSYARIELPSGLTGWVPEAALAAIDERG